MPTHWNFGSLDKTIEKLEWELAAWKREAPDPKSAMKKSDIRFLETRVNRLRKLRQKNIDLIEKIAAEVKEHTADW